MGLLLVLAASALATGRRGWRAPAPTPRAAPSSRVGTASSSAPTTTTTSGAGATPKDEATRAGRTHPAPLTSAGEDETGASPGGAWASSRGCREALAARPPRPDASRRARLGAWNVRWFPDGHPGRAAPAGAPDGGRTTGGTDLAWLACAIALLDVDVLALEELKSTPRASDALAWLRAELGRLTGRDYRVEVDRCPGMGRQSVGLLWDAARVRGSDFSNLGSLNPLGGCALLRPGFAGYFQFPGGLDLHVAAVHLKSGDDPRSYSLRREALGGLEAAAHERRAARPDEDLLFLGDFNTMGCRDCAPRVKGEGELSVLDQELGAGDGTLTRLPLDRPCTHYYQGRGSALDHVLATREMAELPAGTRVEVHGHCAVLGCRPYRRGERPATLDALSDHCPVVVTLDDRDDDR